MRKSGRDTLQSYSQWLHVCKWDWHGGPFSERTSQGALRRLQEEQQSNVGTASGRLGAGCPLPSQAVIRRDKLAKALPVASSLGLVSVPSEVVRQGLQVSKRV